MDIAKLISTYIVQVISTAVSVLAAIGSAWLSYRSSKALEERKGELQLELERRKRDLQEELEGVKARYQIELEVQKSELQSNLEAKKQFLQQGLEEFKAGITDELAAQSARRSYEYDARKNLYAKVEPLLFQLFEAAEGAFHAVTSLVRSQQLKKLPAALSDPNKYYVHSIIHRLFLPLAILRLIQHSTTLVDLNLDPSIRLRYALLKQSYLTWTDDFGIAQLVPKLEYDPNNKDWKALREANPTKFWRQGLVIGSVDRLIDAMVAENTSPQRPMNFGEWEAAVGEQGKLHQAYKNIEDIFLGFEFHNRPVLGRVLTGYACMMHTLMSVYRMTAENPDLKKIISDFETSKDKSGSLRFSDKNPDLLEIVRPYVLQRFEQVAAGDYAKF
jgi:hypothetical protein